MPDGSQVVSICQWFSGWERGGKEGGWLIKRCVEGGGQGEEPEGKLTQYEIETEVRAAWGGGIQGKGGKEVGGRVRD